MTTAQLAHQMFLDVTILMTFQVVSSVYLACLVMFHRHNRK